MSDLCFVMLFPMFVCVCGGGGCALSLFCYVAPNVCVFCALSLFCIVAQDVCGVFFVPGLCFVILFYLKAIVFEAVCITYYISTVF